MLITKKPKRKIIKEIIEEILQAIEDSFVTIAKDDYISYILYIGRADVIPELKAHFGTSCVIDYQSFALIKQEELRIGSSSSWCHQESKSFRMCL